MLLCFSLRFPERFLLLRTLFVGWKVLISHKESTKILSWLIKRISLWKGNKYKKGMVEGALYWCDGNDFIEFWTIKNFTITLLTLSGTCALVSKVNKNVYCFTSWLAVSTLNSFIRFSDQSLLETGFRRFRRRFPLVKMVSSSCLYVSRHAKHNRTPRSIVFRRTVQHVRRHVTLCIGDLEVGRVGRLITLVEMRVRREVCWNVPQLRFRFRFLLPSRTHRTLW